MFSVRFLISHCHVIRWSSRNFLYSEDGIENGMWYGGHVTGAYSMNQRTKSVKPDRMFSVPVRNAQFPASIANTVIPYSPSNTTQTWMIENLQAMSIFNMRNRRLVIIQ